MVESKSNFKEVALASISYWETLSQEDKLFSAGSAALSYFYLGNGIKAREASALYSASRESEFDKAIRSQDRITRLFDAALYASLAQNKSSAKLLWQKLIQQRRILFPEKDVVKRKTAQCWIYEAYGLLKLEEYKQVEIPAKIGLEGLRKGKGRVRSVRQNVREYGLVNVMINLSAYMISPNQLNRDAAQKALEKYKKENFKYGKLGYEVIFDLQISYPDVFSPVLPSSDPEND